MPFGHAEESFREEVRDLTDRSLPKDIANAPRLSSFGLNMVEPAITAFGTGRQK